MCRFLLVLCIGLLPFLNLPLAAAAPTDNPAAKYKLDWTAQLRWDQVVNIRDVSAKGGWDEKLAAAQQQLAGKNGGVVYFPPGVYPFKNSIKLKDGIILRGADPKMTDAKQDGYEAPARIEFPKYAPKMSGAGTPIDTAFRGIYVEDPEKTSNCGVVNISINRGHIRFEDGKDHRCGKNRLVIGCVLRQAAQADPSVPNRKIGQHPWQRFTARHHAAIHVMTAENSLIANNRLPKSGDDNFLQKGYVLLSPKREKMEVADGVLFDYDNRPGIYANNYGIGAGGGDGPAGTPKTHPWGFRKGIVIRDNFIYCSGRCAIAFTGDGVYCGFNIIRFPEGLKRWTATGQQNVTGSSTNDNRAVQMRGYRWVVEGNDYIVYSNIAMPSGYRINDGEGLMHEAHVNSAIKDSKLLNNTGNAYLSLYRVRGIDGLLIKGNRVKSHGKISAIFVLSGYHKLDFPCRNCIIEDNTTETSGILIEGNPGVNNIVRNNRHLGPGGILRNRASAKLENNRGYKITKE